MANQNERQVNRKRIMVVGIIVAIVVVAIFGIINGRIGSGEVTIDGTKRIGSVDAPVRFERVAYDVRVDVVADVTAVVSHDVLTPRHNLEDASVRPVGCVVAVVSPVVVSSVV